MRKVLSTFLISGVLAGAVLAGEVKKENKLNIGLLDRAGAKIVQQKSLGDIIEIVVEFPNGNKEVGYVTKDNRYLIIGQVIDLKTNTNITKIKRDEVNKVDFSKIPLEYALHIKFGKGGKKLVMVSDPDCPFCRKAFNYLKEKDVDLYIYLFPLEIHPNAYNKSVQILCSKDPVKAMIEAEEGKSINVEKCKEGEDNLKRQILIATKLKVNGTPLFITEEGKRINGANIPEIERYLKKER